MGQPEAGLQTGLCGGSLERRGHSILVPTVQTLTAGDTVEEKGSIYSLGQKKLVNLIQGNKEAQDFNASFFRLHR